MGSPKKMYEHFEQNLAMSDIFALTLSRFDAISCALSVSRSVYWLNTPDPAHQWLLYSVSGTYVIKQSYDDLSVAQNREITEIV